MRKLMVMLVMMIMRAAMIMTSFIDHSSHIFVRLISSFILLWLKLSLPP